MISSEKNEHFAASSEYLYLFLAAWNFEQETGSNISLLQYLSAFLLSLLMFLIAGLNQGTLG